VVSPHRLVAVPIGVTTGPVEAGAPRGSEPEPVTERNPGVLYGLGNLVENAIDFAASKVEVEARWSKDEVRIVIADDGAGFPPYVLEQLGEPFVTARRARSEKQESSDEHIGMGLGFFIAKTLLERSGATLLFENRPLPEKGAVIRLSWSRSDFEQSLTFAAT